MPSNYNIPTDKSGRPVRVINSNTKLDDLLLNIYKDRLVVEEPENNEKEEPKVSETSEEILAMAHGEAERIISEAKKRADQMISEAVEKSVNVKNSAYESGYKEGKDQGYNDGYSDGAKQYDLRLAELDAKSNELDEKYRNEMQELEPLLLNTITEVVDKVFHVQFEDKKDLLMYLVQNSIMNIEKAKTFEIHLCESQKDYIEKHKDEIQKKVGENIKIDIVSDETVARDYCTIVTDTGVFECGFPTQLDNLIRDLKSLAYAGE